MKSNLAFATLALGVALAAGQATAQQGVLSRAVGGYSFDEAAKESPGTKNFNSRDGRLTLAIITHTAGNGFFDPTHVGAKVAAEAFGINLVMLGSEAPVDDIPRQIQIINQIINDPTIDGVILTKPQAGAYDDFVKRLTERNIPIATTNSFDGSILNCSSISHTGQDASAAAIGGELLVRCLLANNVRGGSIVFPNTTTLGNVEVNNRIRFAFEATVKALNAAGRLRDFRVDAGPQNIGIDVDASNAVNSIRTMFESRRDVVGAFTANGFTTPAMGDAITQMGQQGKICAFGFDLGPKQQEQIRTGALTGSLGQQPFLQGFWPVMQLYLQIDRGISAANLDTRAQLVTKETVDRVGKRFEN